MPQPGAPQQGRDPPAQMPAANPDLARVLVSRLQAAAARRVLDLGCGDGAVAAMLTEAGFDVTGIDPAPDNLMVIDNHDANNQAWRLHVSIHRSMIREKSPRICHVVARLPARSQV